MRLIDDQQGVMLAACLASSLTGARSPSMENTASVTTTALPVAEASNFDTASTSQWG